MKTQTRIAAGALMAVLLTAAVPAAASEARIAHGDLDLARASDAARLDARIEAAADRLCRDARRINSRISDRDHCRAAVRREVLAALPTQARTDYAAARPVLDY